MIIDVSKVSDGGFLVYKQDDSGGLSYLNESIQWGDVSLAKVVRYVQGCNRGGTDVQRILCQ